jgi:PKD repeat protein
MEKKIGTIAFWVTISIGLAAFFVPAISAGGVVYTEASVNPEEINLGETTTVTLRAVANETTENRDVDVMLVTDRSWSMRQSGWALIKEEEPAHTFNDVSVPGDNWSAVNTFSVDLDVDKLAAEITWDSVPGYEGSEASEVVINLQRPDGTWIFAYPSEPDNASGIVDPPDSVGRSNEYYSGICTKPQSLLVDSPNDGTWKVAVYGWNLRPETSPPASIKVNISVYVDHADNPNDDLDKTDTSLSIEAAKNATKSFIANMKGSDRAGYVKFGSYGVLAQNLAFMDEAGKSSINMVIDDTGLEGGTKINTGIDKAKDELVNNSRDDVPMVIVLLTDGQNDYGASPVLQSAQAAKNADIMIFTIGLTAFVNEEMLKEVATKHDYYYYAPTGAQLQEIYTKISEEINEIAGARAYHVLPYTVEYVGNASIEPNIIGGNTLEWIIGDLAPETPWEVTFDCEVKPGNSGNQPVNVLPDSNVTYTCGSTPGNVPFPGVFVDVKTPPVADFSWTPTEPHTGETVTFDASSSHDPDGGSIVSYEWSFGATGKIVTQVFGSEGNHTVTLTITDDEGKSAEVSKVVEVVSSPSENVNQPPVAVAKADNTTVQEYMPVMFDGSDSYDPDGYIINHCWDFGDGNESTHPGPVHMFEESGTYTVSLIVEDNDGKWSEPVTLTITVTPPSTEPVNFSVLEGGAETDSAHIGEPVTIWVNTAGNSSVTYQVFAGDYEIGTEKRRGPQYFTYIPMTSGEYKIKVRAKVENYDLEWIIDVVNVWIKHVK